MRFARVEAMPVAMAHGDFTPWNMYETTNKLHVYDWEMACDDQPLLFDLFHYVFQTNILIRQKDFSTIQKELDQIKKTTQVRQMIREYSIDWNIHFAYYLLYIATYYVPLYIKQKDLHMQAHWLIDVWTEALSTVALHEMHFSASQRMPQLQLTEDKPSSQDWGESHTVCNSSISQREQV